MEVQHIDLGYRPHRFQLEIHEKARRFTVTVAHRRFGKTYCAITTLVDAALAARQDASQFAYIAPFLKQAKRTSWDYLKFFSTKVPGTEVREGDLTIRYPNGSKVMLFGADNAEAMRGMYFDGVVPDEMADFRPDVWPAVIRPTLSDRKGWAFFIGTPKGVNQFSELYQYGLTSGDPEWVSLMFRADETGLIDEKELASARNIMSDAQYRQEFLCDFNASSDNVLLTIDMVSDAARRVLKVGEVDDLPKILGVDVARFGTDRSAIQRRQGLWAMDPYVFTKMDNMDLVGHLTSVCDNWQPDAVFIDSGRGEGVIDRMRQLGYDVIEVNFGGKPTDNSYVNKRSEMWDQMAEWIKAGGVIPNNADLKSDLCVPTYRFDAANRLMLESKDDIKKRGMRSPDIADALALTFALPVRPKAKRYSSPQIRAEDYNPFAEPARRREPMRSYDAFR
jgi:hypothetical protein